jgi:anti-sigma B factor antagonist
VAFSAVSTSTSQRPGVRTPRSDSPITNRDLAGVCVIEASQELDLATAVELCAQVDAARRAGHKRLLIDLTRLEFCDASGLRALIGAAEEVRASAGRLVVVPPLAGAAARLFALMGADELLPLRSSVADGLAALGGREGG